jgi:hypothetical protein
VSTAQEKHTCPVALTNRSINHQKHSLCSSTYTLDDVSFACRCMHSGARASVYAATDRGVTQYAGCYLAANAKPGKLLPTDPELTRWTWNWSKSMVQLPDDWDLPA